MRLVRLLGERVVRPDLGMGLIPRAYFLSVDDQLYWKRIPSVMWVPDRFGTRLVRILKPVISGPVPDAAPMSRKVG